MYFLGSDSDSVMSWTSKQKSFTSIEANFQCEFSEISKSDKLLKHELI